VDPVDCRYLPLSRTGTEPHLEGGEQRLGSEEEALGKDTASPAPGTTMVIMATGP
jgi:hypothetical protein